jgi:hypothetical protein
MAQAILGGRFSWRPISKQRALMFGESPMRVRNGTKKEKQFDVIAKSIILSSLDVGVFNRVFNCENAHELWKTIKEQNEGSKEVANERYSCLLEEFNTFKHLANENAESMYSCLNVLVNEINALGVKNITDVNINRNIL